MTQRKPVQHRMNTLLAEVADDMAWALQDNSIYVERLRTSLTKSEEDMLSDCLSETDPSRMRYEVKATTYNTDDLIDALVSLRDPTIIQPCDRPVNRLRRQEPWNRRTLQQASVWTGAFGSTAVGMTHQAITSAQEHNFGLCGLCATAALVVMSLSTVVTFQGLLPAITIRRQLKEALDETTRCAQQHRQKLHTVFESRLQYLTPG